MLNGRVSLRTIAYHSGQLCARGNETRPFSYPRYFSRLPLELLAIWLATPAGLEPATCRLEGGCSIQLSYGAEPMSRPGLHVTL